MAHPPPATWQDEPVSDQPSNHVDPAPGTAGGGGGAATVAVGRDGAVSWITLSRPDQANALTSRVRVELLAALRAADADPGVRAVVLTGSGRAFSAGQELGEHAEELRRGGPAAIRRAIDEEYNPLVRQLATMGTPVVAALNGACAGAALGLALACDIRLAADTARLVPAFCAIGLSADAGVTWLLPRVVGPARARALLLANEAIGAEQALSMGLVDAVVPAGELAERSRVTAERLATGATLAYGAVKQAVLGAMDHDLEWALAAEAATQERMVATADHAEGVAAFLAKRAPVFEGR